MPTDENTAQSMIPAALVLTGAGSVITQSVLFREMLVIFYGSELILGFILSSWLIWVFAGAFLFNRTAPRIKNPIKIMVLLLSLFSLALPLLIPLVRNSRLLSGTDRGQLIPFYKTALLASFVTLLPGLLTGYIFPLGCRVIKGPRGFSSLYIMESMGSLTGGLLFSFYLCGVLSSFHVGALLNTFFALFLIIFIWKSRIFSRPLSALVSLLLLMVTAGLWGGAESAEKATILSRWRSLAPDMPLLKSVDSPYQNLVLTGWEDQYSVYFNGLYGFSFPDSYQDSVTAGHLLAQAGNPSNMLIIGHLTPGLARELLKNNNLKKITAVQLDSALYSITESCMDPRSRQLMKGPRINIVQDDGRAFLNRAGESFDLIYLNMSDPTTASANRFYTVQFFRLAKKSLSPRGALAISVSSSENYLWGDILDYNGTIYNSLGAVFERIAICPSTPAFFFSSGPHGTITEEWKELFDRCEKDPAIDSAFSAYIFECLYDRERIKSMREVFSLSKAPINSDLYPTAYLYGIKLWDRYSDSRLWPLIDFIQNRGTGPWFLIFALIALWVTLNIRRAGKQSTGEGVFAYGAFANGFCAMGLSLILIYYHQSTSGCLYRDLAFLSALFMTGLVAGGSSASISVKNGSYVREKLLVGFLLLILLCLFLTPLLELISARWSGGGWPVFLLMWLSGFLSGHILPLSSYFKGKDSHSNIAGLLWGADHLGGALGALLLGAFLVPILGAGLVGGLLSFILASALLPILFSFYKCRKSC